MSSARQSTYNLLVPTVPGDEESVDCISAVDGRADCRKLYHVAGDPLSPPEPEPVFFQVARGSWTLSRYADVVAALRDPRLQQAGAGGQPVNARRDGRTQSQVHQEVQRDIFRATFAEWRAEMDSLARRIFHTVHTGRSVDLVRDVIQPWAIALTLNIERADRLRSSARPLDRQTVPLGKSMFLGLSETLPGFLANAWLALLRHPAEMTRLRARPSLMPNAMEELLRYAGIVHTLHRWATSDLRIGKTEITAGQFAVLKIASANRDPEKFVDPDRLDVSRRVSGQLGLGAGPHACVGARLVRMALAAATPVFVERFPVLPNTPRVQWRRDATLCYPAAIPVSFGR